MNWIQGVKNNLLPLSDNKIEIDVALKEWLYTGEAYDLEADTETCELCGYPSIQYQFQIENFITRNVLLVGSECIKKFQLRAIDNTGHILNLKKTQRVLSKDRRRLISDGKTKHVINKLVELSTHDTNFNFDNFIKYYKERKAFTPKQIDLILWKFDEYKIDFKPSNFKMTIRRKREKKQLQDMDDWKINRIKKCLSPSQRAYLKKI